jgi:hypothetical protein
LHSSDAQCKYSITKIELLAIVETLKEFKGMLWGKTLKVFTDHKNLMRDALGLTLDQVYQWRLLLEEYRLKIVYKKAYTIQLQMQSHAESKTPVSIKQLKASTRRKSGTRAIRDKAG